MRNNVQYGYIDIQRYLQKQMSEKEMHAFEKAMMEDPFLADALEGYQASNNSTANKHLTEIHSTIKGEERRQKLVSIEGLSNNWLRVAAIFILVAGLGTLAYLFNSSTGSNDVNIAATEALKTPSEVDSIKPILESDSFAAKESLLSSESLASSSKTSGSPVIKYSPKLPAVSPPADRNNNAIAMRSQPSDSTEVQAGNISPSAFNELKPARSMRKVMLMKASAENEFTGKVVDVEGQALVGATVITKDNKATATDSKGNFTITSPDTTTSVSISIPGHKMVTENFNRSTPNKTITLLESDQNLSEAVTTNFRTRGSPVVGWSAFSEYLDSAVQAAKRNDRSLKGGTVELEFTVDEKGNPVQVKSRRRVNKALRDKAILILKQGPRWVPTRKNMKTKATIEF
jgi:hypothetical protein